MKLNLAEQQDYHYQAEDHNHNFIMKIIKVKHNKVVILAEDRIFNIQKSELQKAYANENLRLL